MAATSAYLACIFYFWAPMTYTLWNVQQQYLKLLIYSIISYRYAIVVVVVVFAASFFLTGLGFAVSLLTLDPLEMLGIRAPQDRVLKR